MPFVQRVVEPKFLSRTSLWDADGKPRVFDKELEAVTNNTLSNALRQLASLVLAANDIFEDLNLELRKIGERSESIKAKIGNVEDKVAAYDPKKVAVPESDICSFALLKNHFAARHDLGTNLFSASTRPKAVQALYEAAAKTPVHLMRQMDRWRRDGHRTSRFFLCTPVLGARRRKIRSKVDIDIETRMPAAVEELRRWTSSEAIGDITVTLDCPNRIPSTSVLSDGDITDGTVISDDEAIDHKLPSPEEQLQVVALKFPPEMVAVDISGRSFDRMSVQRRSLLHTETEESASVRRRTRTRKPRSRRRNTLAGTDQKEIQDALISGEEPTSVVPADDESESPVSTATGRSKSSDVLRSSSSKKESPENKKSHFNSLKQWGKNRLRMINKYAESKSPTETAKGKDSPSQEENVYETVTLKRKRSTERERRSLHERQPSCSSSSEKSSISIPMVNTSSVTNTTQVKLRNSSEQSRQRRAGDNKDEPHSSSGNWSASSESGRASIGSEITAHPKSTTTSNNSLNTHPPGSVNSRRRYNVNTSTSGSATSEGTLTPDIIHDLHEDGETSSVYSCDTEGYYTSFHVDSGLKTLKEEDGPATPLHSTSTFSNSSSNNTILTAENEYELFGKGSTSTTTSSAGTVCTTLRASESNRSLAAPHGPAVPERKSSLYKQSKSPESSLERDVSSEKTGTVKRSPLSNKATVVAVIHKQTQGDVSPDSGHNTSSSPIESISSPNGVRSGSEFEFSESSDMEGPDRIERIRVKTTINSSRIPSMCAITPPHSDDESVKSHNFDVFEKNNSEMKMNQLNKAQEIRGSSENFDNKRVVMSSVNGTKKMQLINVNPKSGYATIETIDSPKSSEVITNVKSTEQIVVNKSVRAASPSGGTVTVKEVIASKSSQPIFKATLLPLNNMFGKLKSNLTQLGSRKDRSPTTKVENDLYDSGEYVTIADVKNNNNEKSPASTNDTINRNLRTVLSGKIRDTEYISLNELPCNESEGTPNASSPSDSLERKRRQGARVTLNAEGKVVYSSDSLPRRKTASSTFEPGPFVKKISSPSQSPLPAHRAPINIRPVGGSQAKEDLKAPSDIGRPLSPQLGKVVIRASSGMTSSTSEIVRMPPSTIVTPTVTPMSPKPNNNNARGAYVHMQEKEEERALSPSNLQKMGLVDNLLQIDSGNAFDYKIPTMDASAYSRRDLANYYEFKGGNTYSTMPAKKSQYILNELPERSVTPDITRGLGNKKPDSNGLGRTEKFKYGDLHKLDDYVPRQYATQVGYVQHQQHPQNKVPSTQANFSESLRISPIDPRSSGCFQSSTPSSKTQEIKSAVNLESRLLSPKKSTMSNEELFAVIHKGMKKMNIKSDEIDRGSPVLSVNSLTPVNSEGSLNKITPVRSPETGYLGDKSRTRMSWSPKNGDVNITPPQNNEPRARLSWACNDRKGAQQTSTLDFKKLLLQVNSKPTLAASVSSKKVSAVERLKLSKEQIQPTPKPPTQEMDILELSRSPRNLGNRKLAGNSPGSPRNVPEKPRPVPKLLSPRSQWRFANPRSDVLSSTILEDCREDESPNSSAERKHRNESNENDIQGCIANSNTNSVTKFHSQNQNKEQTAARRYMTVSERLQAQRAQFFNSGHNNFSPRLGSDIASDKPSLPTLETAF